MTHHVDLSMTLDLLIYALSQEVFETICSTCFVHLADDHHQSLSLLWAEL